MNKALLILGKILMIFSLLWPIPFGFVFPLLSWVKEIQPHSFGWLQPILVWYYDVMEQMVLGRYFGYWWPLLIVFASGFALCCLSSYKAQIDNTSENTISPYNYLFKTIKWTTVAVLVFLLFVLVIIGVYYAFFTRYLTIVFPVGAALAIAAYFIYVGVKFYKKSR